TPRWLPTSARRAVLELFLPPIARIRSTWSTIRRRAFWRSVVGSQIVLQSRNSPPFGTTIACSALANSISSSMFFVVWLTTATLRGGVILPSPVSPRFAFHGRCSSFLAATDLLVLAQL